MAVQEGPLVTVLTPVYNGEKYLAECIESVCAQTYRNWEYIVVNNCSRDATEAIARTYAERDSRIRIHSNGALVSMSENHNIALDQLSARSRYCKFVHADDWLYPECLARMVDVAEANPSVGIVGAYGLDGAKVKWDGLPYPSTVTPGRDVCRRSLLEGLYVFGSPTSVLFRSDLVRGRKGLYKAGEFDSLYCDQDACYEILCRSDFGFVHQVLTFSRAHDESRTSAAARTRLNHDWPARLNIVRKFGPLYLSEPEFEGCQARLMDRYYGFLGYNLLTGRDRAFWDFHRRALQHMGYSLSRPRVFAAMGREAFRALSSPARKAFTVLQAHARSGRR